MLNRNQLRPLSLPPLGRSSPREAHIFPVCPYHSDSTLDLFCEDPCRFPICARCKQSSHKDHLSTGFVEKANRSNEKLEEALRLSQKKSDAVEKRLVVLGKCISDIETCTRQAVTEIRSRCHDLTAELSKVTNRQVMVVSDGSHKQLTKFRNEARELERLNQQMHNFEQNASKLLANPTSLNFINQSRMLLEYEYNEGSYRQEYTQNAWRRPVFKAPATQSPITSEDFLNFMEDHVLGPIDVEIAADEEKVDEKDESMNPKSDSESELSSPTLQHQQIHNQSQISLGAYSTSQYSSSAFSSSVDTDITNILDTKSVASRKSTYVEDALSSEHTVAEVKKVSGVKANPRLSKTRGKIVLKLDFHLKGSPKGTRLRKFHDVTFSDHSMWLCGWTRNKGRSNDIVLVQLQGPNYDVRCKEKKSDKEAGLPNFVQFYGGYLLFAKKGSKEDLQFEHRQKWHS